MIMMSGKTFGGGMKWKEALQASQLGWAVGIGVQVARGL
jgi:hypothetical protein